MTKAARISSGIAPRWSDVLASIDDGLVVLDPAGVVVDINPAAEQLMALAASQVLGSHVEAVFDAHTGNQWIADLALGTLRTGLACRRIEGALARRRGTVAVRAACAPVLDARGGVGGVVLALHDLTMQRTLEEATRRAERLSALGTVALGLAHEIRNPLGGIKGAAQLLRGSLDDPEQTACTDLIVREVERLDRLIEQLRELSHPPRLDIHPLNIHRVLNDVLALQRRSAAWRNVRLRTEFDPSLPAVRGDVAQLTQVFLNLIKNALEALDGAGELVVSTRMDHRFLIRRPSGRGQQLAVTIEDTGPGIPEDVKTQLFAPFFTTKNRGTGLGLALSQRIVNEHGGAIEHESRPGGGTRFRVTLPVEPDHGDAS